ncbi:transglutaminase domain-containing protein [Sutcliffiella rhizosphaerae]|uniref:Transglutaminase-like domain-containing protein n=1 Tax=Sutcliffiella rhizosphaerae TaxID=2880967 RepID=A0ABN8ABF1_9BACI|nr:transglutaminase-like domain-containing protein [Sutcliffiella rhizosphaerae]CAG9622513.1 hypothetical protein BACCIP111883_03304 [Sutcliffiella rhizosphaerae]
MALKHHYYTALLISCSLFLTACSDKEVVNQVQNPPVVEEQKDQDNVDLQLDPLELSSYAEEVKATIISPLYKEFTANGTIEISGYVEKHAELKSNYVWVKVNASEDGPLGKQLDYYIPIKDGNFSETLSFFNGEGEYKISIQLPDIDRENYYYDAATFKVNNTNSESVRDVTFTPFGHDASLKLDVGSSFVKTQENFNFSGTVDTEELMLRLKKDSETWKHVISIKNGEFAVNIPLFFGRGIHELEVMVPDRERENYYQPATTIFIDNTSDRVMQPLEFFRAYEERGVTLEHPQYGGDEVNGIYSVKGQINPVAEFAQETTHIYISSKKGDDEALDVIPVENLIFDGSFYLRFGPGTYEITLSVPEIKEENSDRFRFFGFAKFEVTSTADDNRDLLPSRGVQSDAPEIITLAKDLTSGKQAAREKALAIYQYVAKNVSYDVQKYKNNEFSWDDSAIKTLNTKTGVCQDYAYLTIALMRASGLEARYVEGRAGSPWPGNHAWVEANIDGQWVEMDPTWGSGYLDRNDTFVANYNEDYFDPDAEEFGKTHTRTGVKY